MKCPLPRPLPLWEKGTPGTTSPVHLSSLPFPPPPSRNPKTAPVLHVHLWLYLYNNQHTIKSLKIHVLHLQARTCFLPVTTLCRFQCGVAKICALPRAVSYVLFIFFVSDCTTIMLNKDFGRSCKIEVPVLYSMELLWKMTFSMFSGRSTVRSSLSVNNLVSISLTVTEMCSRPIDSLHMYMFLCTFLYT